MSGVTVDGLVSGLDTTAIINAYLSVAGASTDRLRSQQSDLEARLTLLQEFNGYLDDLQAAVGAYEDASDLRLSTAVSSAEAVMTATAGEGAQAGTYDVTVVSLARSEMEVSQGYSSSSDVVATSGDITVTIDGVDYTIEVSEANGNNTLSSLASAIDDEVEGVSAYIMNDGGASPYRLVIMSDQTGADQAISISSTLAGGTAPSFTEQIAAADAEITLAGLTVNSSTNRFVDVVPGLTMEAGSVGATTITVDMDGEAVVEAAQGFVDAYNTVANFIAEYTGLGADGTASALAGESVLSSVASHLQTVMSGLYVEGDLRGTSVLGFATQQDGTLELDTAKLTSALEDHPDETLAILAGPDGIFSAMDGRLEMVLDPDTGSIALRQDSLDGQIEDLDDQIARSEANLAIYESALRQQFTNLELVLAQMNGMSSYLTQLFAQNNG